jgi:hypothetical protein
MLKVVVLSLRLESLNCLQWRKMIPNYIWVEKENTSYFKSWVTIWNRGIFSASFPMICQTWYRDMFLSLWFLIQIIASWLW